MEKYYKVISSDELYHHGIKGQKWGIRRFENPDGTLTPEGKERYGSISKKERKKQEWIESYSKTNKVSKEVAEKQYKLKKKLETGLKIIGAASVAAVVGYSIYKVGKNDTMDIIEKYGATVKSGETLHRIANDVDLTKNFYAVNDKADALKYQGRLGLLRLVQKGEMPYKIKMDVVKDIKVAGKDVGDKVFKDMYNNDPDFRKTVRIAANLLDYGIERTDDVNELMLLKRNPLLAMFGDRKIPARNVDYKKFNHALVVHNNPEMLAKLKGKYDFDGQWNKFYDKLKSMGYGAVYDLNDGGRNSNSQYNAKNPMIVFDKSAVIFNTSKRLNGGKIAVGLLADDMVNNGYKYILNAGLGSAYGLAMSIGYQREKILREAKQKKKSHKKKRV